MGLDPEILGEFFVQRGDDPDRCIATNEKGERCARKTHPGGTMHARGYDRWQDGDVTRSVLEQDSPQMETDEGFSTSIPRLSGTSDDPTLRDELVALVAHALRGEGIAGDFTKSGQEICAEIAVDTVLERLRHA